MTCGENRILVALKEDGEVLEREARIVSAQSPSRIADLFLLEHPLDAATVKALEGLPLEKKRERLAALDARVELSPEARDAILGSDIVIYGPGTQYSSIFPSYKTRGLAEALRSSRVCTSRRSSSTSTGITTSSRSRRRTSWTWRSTSWAIPRTAGAW